MSGDPEKQFRDINHSDPCHHSRTAITDLLFMACSLTHTRQRDAQRLAAEKTGEKAAPPAAPA